MGKEKRIISTSFTANKKQTIALCEEMINRGLHKKLKWSCETHSKVSDYDLFCLMKEAGCYNVALGMESGSNYILKETGKSTTIEIIKEASDMVRRAKLNLGGLFILGHPYETKRTMLQTISFGIRLNPDTITFSMMTPFPGTKVYDFASKNEAGLKLLTNDWEKYDSITGAAMNWNNFSIRTLKAFQFFGLVFYHLYNFRIRQFVKYLSRHKRGIVGYFLSFSRIGRNNTKT